MRLHDELNEVREVYICIRQSRVIMIAFNVSTFSWIRLSRMLKNVIDTKLFSLKVVLLTSFTYIWISTPRPTKHAHACQQQGVFFKQYSFVFFTCKSIYLKYPQCGQKIEPIISNNMWPHVLIYEVGSYFPCFFCYILGLYFVSSRIWQFSTYFKDGKVLESTVSWLPIGSNRLQP